MIEMVNTITIYEEGEVVVHLLWTRVNEWWKGGHTQQQI